jgi:DNA-binding SARP family transcriptional activator/tetratricopeptide (TPR) repeat protein
MLHVSLLGEQAITEDATGTVLTRSPRTVALLAFLVTHAGLPQSRQRIAELFWPDSTTAQALTNLRRELHHLRHALGDEPALVVTSQDLCWCDTETNRVDIRTFVIEHKAAKAAASVDDTEAVLVHAATALAQYRGELMPGRYDTWLLEARSELERQCVDLCDLVCKTRARGADLPVVLDAARRRIQLRPLEEVGYRALMELQADLGDRADAVSTYHHCASILERELGVVPDQATRKALQRLLTPRQREQALSPRNEPATGRSGFPAAELVGRSRELALLQTRWRTACAGRPGIVLVRGSAGVGKTRLLAEAAKAARRHGAVVASTQCFGTSGRLALAPVADWLRNPAVQAAAMTLAPVWRAEVDRLMPSGKGPGEPRAGPRATVDAWQRHRFFEGLARALTGVGRPLLVILDNMQWCDQATLAFLTFCLGLVPDAPILVAGALADGNSAEDPELVAWSVRMRAVGLLSELRLDPLELSDTARLAEAISGRLLLEEDRELLQATTGGFPLYIVEAMRTTVDSGRAPLPVGDLTAVLRSRLEQAPAAAREVAGLAAAVGRNFTLDLLTEASDLEADLVVQAVDELWRRRIIHEFRDGYDFSHDLLRETAYAQVSPPKRWLMHRRLAQSLELLHAEDTDPVSAQLAEQYARAGRTERAVTYYRRAAEVASSTFAHAEAIRLHKQALAIVRSQPEGRKSARRELDILEAMAAPLNARYGFSSPELQRVLERSIDLADTLGHRDSTVTGLIGLWATRFVQGRTADAHAAVSRALTLVDPDSELSGSAHFAFAGSAVSLGRPAQALHHFALATALTRGAPSLTIGTRPEVHGSAWAAHAHWLLGHDEEVLASCHNAIKLARMIDHPYSLAVALGYAGITYQMRQDLPGLREIVDELRESCDHYGFAYYREWGLVLDGWCRGDGPAIDLARRGIENLKSEGAYARMPYWLSMLADLLARNDRHDAARATLDAALSAGQAREDLWWLPEVMRMRAAYDEDQEAAARRVRSAAQLAHAHGSVTLLRRCERDLATRGVLPSP